MVSKNGTPAKRRKLNGASSSKPYDSQDDSGDEIFDTVDTVVLPRKATQPDWTTSHFVTQPTQMIGNENPHALDSDGNGRHSIVQVPGSSPVHSSNITSQTPTPRKQILPLYNSMAPAGTAFRPPAGIVSAPVAAMTTKSATTDLSDDDDDGPTYRGGSSDEESQLMKADIRPSSFVIQAQKTDSSKGIDRFKEITSTSRYDPTNTHRQQGTATPMSSSDVMANAYGGARRAHSSQHSQQANPARAQPIVKIATKDIPLDSIPDHQMRTKIRDILAVLPSKLVKECRDALLDHKNNYTDALAFLVEQDEKFLLIDLTADEDPPPIEPNRSQPPTKKPAAKQQIKAPIQKIHEKWNMSQRKDQAWPSSPLLAKPSKPRRRLIQGRKGASSPAAEPVSSPPVRTIASRSTTPESDAFDSGLGEGISESGLESRVLQFFNSCSAPDLIDIAATSQETALMIVSHKPFSSLDDVRRVSAKGSGNGKTKKMKVVGDKIVEKCLEMWAGYEAVDELVKRCKDLARPLTQAMAKWGVDVYGSASRAGELEIVGIGEGTNNIRDSGIGTPTSRSASADEDCEGDVSKPASVRKHGYFGQPLNMSKDKVLKDYQIVGINWLSLIFDQGLSGILADGKFRLRVVVFHKMNASWC